MSDELRGNATLKKRARHLEGKSWAVAALKNARIDGKVGKEL